VSTNIITSTDFPSTQSLMNSAPENTELRYKLQASVAAKDEDLNHGKYTTESFIPTGLSATHNMPTYKEAASHAAQNENQDDRGLLHGPYFGGRDTITILIGVFLKLSLWAALWYFGCPYPFTCASVLLFFHEIMFLPLPSS